MLLFSRHFGGLSGIQRTTNLKGFRAGEQPDTGSLLRAVLVHCLLSGLGVWDEFSPRFEPTLLCLKLSSFVQEDLSHSKCIIRPQTFKSGD